MTRYTLSFAARGSPNSITQSSKMALQITAFVSIVNVDCLGEGAVEMAFHSVK